MKMVRWFDRVRLNSANVKNNSPMSFSPWLKSDRMPCWEWFFANRKKIRLSSRRPVDPLLLLDLMNERSTISISSTMNYYTSKLCPISLRWSNENWRERWSSKLIHSKAKFVSDKIDLPDRSDFVLVSIQSGRSGQILVHHSQRFSAMRRLRERRRGDISRRRWLRQTESSE